MARAAASSGTIYSLATGSSYTLEEVAAATDGPKMFLASIYKDRDVTAELIERCKKAKYAALCLTVAVPAIGKRERDLRSGFATWHKCSPGLLMDIALHPASSPDHLR